MQPIASMSTLYEKYEAKMRKIADLKYAAAVLEWDQETYLPEKGAEIRARQLATLSAMAHSLFTEARLGDLLKQLSDGEGLTDVQRGNVARSTEDYEINKKYPPAFIQELSLTTSACYHAWMKARRENDFGAFEPSLQKMVVLKKRQADLLGFTDHPYDALVNDFEKGTNVRMLDTIFEEVKTALHGILREIGEAPQVDNRMLRGHFDKEAQWAFGMEVLETMGFDFLAGRQDISEHPFTTNFNSRDVRITTRMDEGDFANMTWSCIHEGGHGLYEQGLPFGQYGLPLGEPASLAIHESQSRLWENNVGRSRAFWKHFYPALKGRFGGSFGQVTPEAFYRGINKVQPSLIRTEADELTYHFHVMIRYELEKKLIGGELKTTDLRGAWNEMYETYLQVTVPDDRRGVLQDVHWSHGSFGYFPTYSLGSFYAAQFFHTAARDLPDLEIKIGSGDFTDLLGWLRKYIHQVGRRYYANDLCEKVTGEKLQFRYFLDYARKKYSGIYGLSGAREVGK